MNFSNVTTGPSRAHDFDVLQDRCCGVEEGTHQRQEVRVQGGKIAIPFARGDFDTVLLKLNIKSTVAGRFSEPSVEVQGKVGKSIQFFERDASGIQYVNISGLQDEAAGTELALKPRRLRLVEDRAEIVAFRTPIDDASKILIISPHPDDAEIAAFGLYSGHCDRTVVVTVTAGDEDASAFAKLFADGDARRRAGGRIRVWNSVTVPMIGGIKPGNAINLGYADGSLRDLYAARDDRSAARSVTDLPFVNDYRSRNTFAKLPALDGGIGWQTLVDDIRNILTSERPDIVVAPYPLIDTHPDHKLSSLAVFEALKSLDIRSGHLLLYTNHHVKSSYYPFGPSHTAVSVPPAVDQPLYFDRLYSFPLSDYAQTMKLLALESMVALRYDADLRSGPAAISRALKMIAKEFLGRDVSYQRRAVRSNEFFFVVDMEKIYDDEILRNITGRL